MSQLTESTEAVLEAGAAVKNSQAYLNGNEITLDGLLQHQESVVEAMSQLSASVVPEELAQRASQVRAQAHEHMQTLRREIKRVQEKGDMPDNFKPKDDTDTNGDTSNSSDGGGNNATPGNKKNGNGDDDSAEEALARVMNLESLRDVTAADIIGELAGRNRELRIQTENQVPEEKYRRAIDLGEDVVERANSDRDFYESQIKQLKEQLQEAKKSDQASRAMLEATVSRYRGEVVENAVDGLLEKNPQLKPIEGRLRECKTLPEVRSLIEGIVKPLSEGTGSSRPDLPPTVSQNLNESVSERGTSPAPAQQSSSGGNDLMGLLAESERSGFPQA